MIRRRRGGGVLVQYPAVKSVARLLTESKWDEALVRLCRLANRVTLNQWELYRAVDEPGNRAFELQVEEFLLRLAKSQGIDEADVASAPLALMRALDRALVNERRARKFSKKAIEVEGCRYWLVPRRCVFAGVPSLTYQPGSLARWMPHHALFLGNVSDIAIEPVVPRGTLAERLETLGSANSPVLKVWVGHFEDGCQVAWATTTSTSGRWWASSISDAGKRRASLEATLDAARDVRADVVVLPELSVSPEMRGDLVAWIDGAVEGRPLLLVAGSFHEQMGVVGFNTAPLVDGCTGQVLLVHRKLRVFGRNDGSDGPEMAEAIEVGTALHVLVTGAGTFGVLICKDFLDAHAEVATLLQSVPVEWALVPSYGSEKTLSRHLRAAEQAAKVTVGCQAVVANIRDVGISQGESLPGFAYSLMAKKAVFVQAKGDLVVLQFTG